MVTKNIPTKFFTLMNCDDPRIMTKWTSPQGSRCIKIAVDDMLCKNVLQIRNCESSEPRCAYTYILNTLDHPGGNLPVLTFLIRRLPNEPVALQVEMVMKPQKTPCMRKETFHLTTFKGSKHYKKEYDLEPVWNILVLRLDEICARQYNSEYLCTQTVRVDQHCDLYRIYMSNIVYNNEELPEGYRLSQDEGQSYATVVSAKQSGNEE